MYVICPIYVPDKTPSPKAIELAKQIKDIKNKLHNLHKAKQGEKNNNSHPAAQLLGRVVRRPWRAAGPPSSAEPRLSAQRRAGSAVSRADHVMLKSSPIWTLTSRHHVMARNQVILHSSETQKTKEINSKLPSLKRSRKQQQKVWSGGLEGGRGWNWCAVRLASDSH